MKNSLIVALLVTAGFAVGALLWKHESDTRRDGRITVADSLRAVEQHRADSLAKVTDSLSRRTGDAIVTVFKVDTVWRKFRDTLTTTVERITHDTVSDSTKIATLGALVLATADSADKVTKAAVHLAFVADSLRKAFAIERKGLQDQVRTATGEITDLKKQSRHWGLVGSIGYGLHPVKMADGTKHVESGPRLHAGFGYRF